MSKPEFARVEPERRVVTPMGLLFAGLLFDEIPNKMYEPATLRLGMVAVPLTATDRTT